MWRDDPRRQHRHGNDPQRQYVGIRVSGLGERWFTAPVNTPQVCFSPASRRSRRTRIWAIADYRNLWYRRCGNDRSAWRNAFVGAGGMEAARAVSEEMAEITLSAICSCRSQAGIFRARAGTGHSSRGRNRHYATHQYRYAHKEAGIGQIGAGTVRAPLGVLNRRWKHWLKAWGLVEERQ